MDIASHDNFSPFQTLYELLAPSWRTSSKRTSDNMALAGPLILVPRTHPYRYEPKFVGMILDKYSQNIQITSTIYWLDCWLMSVNFVQFRLDSARLVNLQTARGWTSLFMSSEYWISSYLIHFGMAHLPSVCVNAELKVNQRPWTALVSSHTIFLRYHFQ